MIIIERWMIWENRTPEKRKKRGVLNVRSAYRGGRRPERLLVAFSGRPGRSALLAGAMKQSSALDQTRLSETCPPTSAKLSPADKLGTRPSANSIEGSFPVPIQNPVSVPCLDNSGSPL